MRAQCVRTCVCTYMRMCVYAFTYVHVGMCVRTCMRTYIPTYMWTYVRTCFSAYVLGARAYACEYASARL